MRHFQRILLLLATTTLLWERSLSFVVPQQSRPKLSLDMAAGGNKKRRRRKDAPTGATALDPIKLDQETVDGVIEEEEDEATIPTEELSQFELKPDGIAQGMASSRSLLFFLFATSLMNFSRRLYLIFRRFAEFLARNGRSGTVQF